mmetsp:Transcript_40890/g.65734  ORF Transcript_40890/g.65734 Transcript_40890/m.65734 type:complete len:261 (-) Transcript_40890:72-854(-)
MEEKSSNFVWTKYRMLLTNSELNTFATARTDHPISWAVWRTLMACYFFAIMIWSIAADVESGNGAWWLIYLTHWTLLVLVVYQVCAATCTWMYGLRMLNIREQPKLFTVTWHLQNILLAAAPLVFILYWGLVYDGGTVRFLTTQTHGANALAIAIDCFFSCQPKRFEHFYQPVIYALIYTIFSIIQEYTGIDNGSLEGTSIYDVTNYKANPARIGFILVLAIFLAPAIYCLLVCWDRLAQYVIGGNRNLKIDSTLRMELN